MPKRHMQPTEYMVPRDDLDVPRNYIERDAWPDGPLKSTAPVEAYLLQRIARDFENYRQRHNESYEEVAKRIRVGHMTLYKLANGLAWPNMLTVSRLERLYDRRMWGNEHREAEDPVPEDPKIVEARRAKKATAKAARNAKRAAAANTEES